jgi:hypothetical protein
MGEKKQKGTVLAVCKKDQPGIPKYEVESIHLQVDLGIVGDYHSGQYVRHRYLVKKEPNRLNNRQVLLIDTIILADLESQGIDLKPGEMGENMVVKGIDLMSLELGSRLKINEVLLELTEIRVPCSQLNGSHPDLHQAVIKTADGIEKYNAGVFAHIITGGIIKPGESIKLLE